jgi:non-heme chloroperoxidase
MSHWLTLVLLITTTGFAQESAPWQDPSKHQVQFVTVEDGVQLEVLDWGGTGRPVVLLAGYTTAHVYDDFAAKLSETCHVYGITRRGLGASSRPDSGYTAQRSTDDVLKVLDSLHLKALPVLVGHSFGGQDLNTLGAEHSDRIAGLVYLDSGEDPTVVDYGVEKADPTKLPVSTQKISPPSHQSFQAHRNWALRDHGFAFPEAELRQLYAANADGTMGEYLVSQNVRDAMFKGIKKPDFADIRVSVLAFFRVPPSAEEQIKKYKPENAEQTAAIKQKYAFDLAIEKRHLRDLKTGVPAARVIELPGANFFIFLSNEADVLRELRVFIAGLH